MGEETKILFENIKNFRHLITEAVSDADMAKYINNHEHILIYYQGDETTASGKRAIRPYVLGTNKSGNKVIRAWEDNGASWHFSNKPTRPSNNPNMTDSDKHDYWTDEKGVKPGWRMFRLDKIQQVYPTGQKFNDENGLVMIPAGYHEGGDKDMVSIDAYVSTKTEPDFEQQYDKEFQGDVISKQDQLKQKWDSVEKKYKNDATTRYDKHEPLAIQLEGADYDVGVAYGPYLQALAITHIMSAAALESHINGRGKEFLNGKTLEQFERISLDAKWLFLPRMLGAKGFDPGAQPYQGFAKLITTRNELVHYKGREEDWQISGSAVPSFLEKLGLTAEAAKQSLESVRGMIKSLAEQLKQEMPYWLRVNETSYFGFRIP